MALEIFILNDLYLSHPEGMSDGISAVLPLSGKNTAISPDNSASCPCLHVQGCGNDKGKGRGNPRI